MNLRSQQTLTTPELVSAASQVSSPATLRAVVRPGAGHIKPLSPGCERVILRPNDGELHLDDILNHAVVSLKYICNKMNLIILYIWKAMIFKALIVNGSLLFLTNAFQI